MVRQKETLFERECNSANESGLSPSSTNRRDQIMIEAGYHDLVKAWSHLAFALETKHHVHAVESRTFCDVRLALNNECHCIHLN